MTDLEKLTKLLEGFGLRLETSRHQDGRVWIEFDLEEEYLKLDSCGSPWVCFEFDLNGKFEELHLSE